MPAPLGGFAVWPKTPEQWQEAVDAAARKLSKSLKK
jgi:hypothetical protein